MVPSRSVSVLLRATRSGSVASIASSLMLAALTRITTGAAAAGSNATSHWIWGERAMHRHRADLAHTVVGYAIHHASSLLWACVYEAARPRRGERLAGVCVRACAVAALAAFVDYRLTPKRLTPGFEAHLSRPGMTLVYAAFAAGLALSRPPRRGTAGRS